MQLIISEKPKAARKIAEALGRVRTQKGGQSYYYEVDDGSIIVAPAVGHVFGLVSKQKSWGYPVFDIEWRPKSEQKGFEYVKSYIANLKKLGKQASEIIIATDYDIEGSVIGHNIVKLAIGKKPLKRMKFSTLTDQELSRAYEAAHPLNKFEQGMVWAGLTRHYMDWYWGINMSRALSQAISKPGQFRALSTGRVQGPTLKLLVDREREINAFSSNFFFQLQLRIGELVAKGAKLEDTEKALELFKQAERPAIVTLLEKTRFDVPPPPPFNLTDLQSEASRAFKYTPKRTQKIAQTLYEGGFISYPRTSSQKIPKEIDTDKILAALVKRYPIAKQLIGKKLTQGKKEDPAHPAIHPTGELPPELEPDEQKLYDLITRRFLASFGEKAVRESVKAILDLKGVEFVLEGRKTIVPGWITIYKYAKLEEKELPKMEKQKELKIDAIELVREQTRPPKRYTEAGLLKTMDRLNIGTKATRANIIQTLFDRKYVTGKSIEVTSLGEEVVSLLEKNAASILS
ncbi:MAG: DNA topoisomerase I, partial [Candidatus Altiarchaeota archaeon]|nr:DNA topoisomerase I [Candidatus Altiarchaeota archaeon]